jgi:hypothetical protein
MIDSLDVVVSEECTAFVLRVHVAGNAYFQDFFLLIYRTMSCHILPTVTLRIELSMACGIKTLSTQQLLLVCITVCVS